MTQDGDTVDRADDHRKRFLPPSLQVSLAEGLNQVEVGDESREEHADQQHQYEPGPVPFDGVAVEEDEIEPGDGAKDQSEEMNSPESLIGLR